MTFQPRYYQTEAIAATFDFWAGGGGNPLIELATGTGKSGVAAMAVKRLRSYKGDMRVGVLAAQQELIQQNAQEMAGLLPGAPIGIYSAGLGIRQHSAQILHAAIQSVYKKANVLGRFDVLLVDECHLLSRRSDSMYGRFIADCQDANPQLRIAGLTATPFRMDSGRLDEGEGRIFEKIVYSYDIAAGIADGYLSPLTSKIGSVEIDVEGVPIRGGEFLEKAMQERALNPDLIIAACREVTAFFRQTNRRKMMIFTTGIAHAHAVAEVMRALGVKTDVVTGDMLGPQRRDVLKAFKLGLSECLVNVGVLATGFNEKGVDLIALMRSTLSTGLYLQMIGRGTRIVIDVNAILTAEDRRAAIAASIKPDCLVLDYGGNFRRHGPIDEIHGAGRKPKLDDKPKDGEYDDAPIRVKADTVRGRKCEKCSNLLKMSATECPPPCGWQVPADLILVQHEREAESERGITKAEQPPDWRDVTSWSHSRHEKAGKPPSLRIDYYGPEFERWGQGEWLAFESTSAWARDKAAKVWATLCGDTPSPATVDEALERTEELTRPNQVLVRLNNGFKEIAAHAMPVVPIESWAKELDDEIPF